MTFRDDREASRARIAALEDELAAAKAETERARKEAAAATSRVERLRAGRARGGKGDATARPSSPVGRVIAVVTALAAIPIGLALWSHYRTQGWPIPRMVGIEEHLPSCACTFADGRAVQLGVRVSGAELLQSPGRPWKMSLTWQAFGVGEPLRLDDPGGLADIAPPLSVQEALDAGQLVEVGVACLGGDRLVLASGAHVTTWSLSQREILRKDRIEPESPTSLSGRRLELRCSALVTKGDTVLVPSKKGDVPIKIPMR